ncbi:uncharacterized protein [Primulina huaijiensis]|uniref:uncharacterized protein n=1 Tax=Primulina huaijiensis TaxID=1492673 RepID=UPI003CC71E05
MNFHEGGPSSFSFYSSSSSTDDEDQPSANIKNELNRIDEQQTVLSQLINSGTVVSNYFQECDNLHRRGSIPGHVVINRDRSAAEQRLYNDYFSESPMYNESIFKRLRMSRQLFLRIIEFVHQHDNYLVKKVDALRRPELSPYQKITAAMRILAYDVASDSTDEYIKIEESTAIESLKRFCQAVVEVFSDWYLWSPIADDIERILLIGKQRGFSWMLGSLDCMHWKWKNCPTSWAGQYATHSGKPTIILEAIADYELWI